MLKPVTLESQPKVQGNYIEVLSHTHTDTSTNTQKKNNKRMKNRDFDVYRVEHIKGRMRILVSREVPRDQR